MKKIFAMFLMLISMCGVSVCAETINNDAPKTEPGYTAIIFLSVVIIVLTVLMFIITSKRKK